MTQKKLLMIVNPRAGRSKPMGPMFDACAILSEAGYLLSVRKTAGNGDAVRIAREEGKDYDLVIAVGGDGTLNETANGLLALENPPLLGYLAQGSTNDFATSLRISNQPAEAAAAMVTKPPRRLDVGDWNGRKFLYVASFGAFTRSSYSAPQAAKNALGHFAYILEGMKDLNTLRPYRVRITADGENLDGTYLFGAVCNSTSLGGLMKLDPDHVVLDDGLFELLLIPMPKSPADLPNLVRSLLDQKYERGGLVFRHVSSLRVETDVDLPWSLDGEFAASAPAVEIRNCEKGLAMLL